MSLQRSQSSGSDIRKLGEPKKRKADLIDDENQQEGWKLRKELEQTSEELSSNLEPLQSNPVPVPTHPQILTEAFVRIDDENLPEGWKLKQELEQTSEDLPSNLEPVQSNPVPGGPCTHIGVGAPLQKINSRASVLTDRERDKIRRERSLRRERALCLTSLPAWWQRVEKEGRQFLREVKRECTARMLKVEERSKKQQEKTNFIKRFFPTSTNSPGGTLHLVPVKISSTQKGGVEKQKAWRSENFPATKLVFDNNCFDNYDMRRISQTESENSKCVISRGGLAVIGSTETNPGQSEERTGGEVVEDWRE
jgi:hypothetical protein